MNQSMNQSNITQQINKHTHQPIIKQINKQIHKYVKQ